MIDDRSSPVFFRGFLPEEKGCGKMYEIIYDFEDEKDLRDHFEGTWTELQNHIQAMKEAGCYHIDATDILPEEDFPEPNDRELEQHNFTSSTMGDYSPGNPWDAPGMSISDFI